MHIRSNAAMFAMSMALLAACAAQGGGDDTASAAMAPARGQGQMGMHGMQAMAAASPAQLAQMDERMRAMQDVHAKMMSAKTPDERRALMAEHRNAMREGMAAMHAAMGGAPCMGPEMMRRKQGMMQMMMQMMAETPEPSAPAPK